VWSGLAKARRAVVLAGGVAVVAVAALVTAPHASAATCWQRVIDDWRDGRISGTYSPGCLRAAMRNLPEDLRVYGSAEEDITRVLTRVVDARAHRVLAATATRTSAATTPTPTTKASEPPTPTRMPTRSLAARPPAAPKQTTPKRAAVAAAAPASTEDTSETALAPARTAVAAGALGLVALAAAMTIWRARRRRANRAL
jgi:hypothetical protein